MALEKALSCPYEQTCNLYFPKGNPMIINSSTERYTYLCMNNGTTLDNCAYLHQLANEDKQTELLEKMLVRLDQISVHL
jgi:hypothetical protein